MNIRKLGSLGVAVLASGVLLAGCTDARKERLAGAERALAAVPDIEVLSRDPAGGILVVRSRRSGTVSTIDLDSKAPLPPPAAAAEASLRDPSGDGAASVQPPLAAAEPPRGADASSLADGTGREGLAATGTAAAPAGTLADSPGDPEPVTANGTTPAPLAAGATVVRDPQGRVQRIEGSGFSIERSPATAGAARPDPRTDAARSGPAPSPAAAVATGARRRIAAPFVCGAGEARTLQGVDLDVPGAGIVAERGCTLTVANVRVRAGGWGLVVNPGASVRIDDSLVEGRTGALDLYPGGSLSAWATTFRGALGRPVASPQFVDRGGNAWE